LQHGQLGDRVPPTPGAAALVDRPARANDRHTGSSSGATTGLTLGVGHGSITDRLARHGSIPKRDVTKHRADKNNAWARSFNRQISSSPQSKATVLPPRRLRSDPPREH